MFAISSLLLILATTTIAIFNLIILAVGEKSLPGKWQVLTENCGISAMHMQLLPDNRVIIFDWTTMGKSNISLPDYAKCDIQHDCSAHSIEFNPMDNDVRPLYIRTDTWCSSGSLASDGVLVQTGGWRNGENAIRFFKPFINGDWVENRNGLLVPRWYSSNQILPNGKIIVVGGRYQFNYEFVPKTSVSDAKLHYLNFLETTTYDPNVPNNLYPFLHLSPDGNLFIFANDRAILLDYVNNKVTRSYPVLPGRISRNYPSTGSSVLLPLRLSLNNSLVPDAEVLVCGGTMPNAFNDAELKKIYIRASSSCGRLKITEHNPNWVMEEMPIERLMGDMILLANGDVLIINGAKNGSAGWDDARDPILNPVLYHFDVTDTSSSTRFEVMRGTKKPRVYHSTALLIPDGRVLVGGSNAHSSYNFSSLYPTDLSIEAFSPPYLKTRSKRPQITWVKPNARLVYGQTFSIGVKGEENYLLRKIDVTMVAPSFTTHSFSMNQRVMFLAIDRLEEVGRGDFVIDVSAPAKAAIAPPGYYLLFVLHDGVPSAASWVQIQTLDLVA